MALSGTEATELFDQIDQACNDVRIAIRRLTEMPGSPEAKNQQEDTAATWAEFGADKIVNKVETAVSETETIFQPILETKQSANLSAPAGFGAKYFNSQVSF